MRGSKALVATIVTFVALGTACSEPTKDTTAKGSTAATNAGGASAECAAAASVVPASTTSPDEVVCSLTVAPLTARLTVLAV